MKKLFFLLIPLLTLTACTSEYDKVLNDARRGGIPGEDGVLYATIEAAGVVNAQTKVYADEDMLVLWNANDRISVFFNNTYNQPYLFKGKDGDNAGGFAKVQTDDELATSNPLGHIYAIYPYDEATSISNKGVFSVELPAEQHFLAHSFSKGANTMVSVTDDIMLSFKNAGGYLSFKLYGEGVSVKSITLNGNNHEKLAGNSTITMSVGEVPAVAMQNDATESITLVCDEPVALNAAASDFMEFWFVVPPTEFTQGFTVTVTDTQGSVFSQTTSNPVTISRNSLSRMEPLEVVPVAPSHQAVDLGLSVKWATCNVGANSPEEYGDYFAWGETTSKENYDWSTYKWCNGTKTTLTKYNTVSSYGTVDKKTVLDLSDDAARANWGGNWRMPTDAEWTELRSKCTWTWTTQNGTNGRLVTGPNGNSIFLPAAGDRTDSSLCDAGSWGRYWSSSLNMGYPYDAHYVYFYSNEVYWYDGLRCCGQSVRPVYDEKPAHEFVDLGLTSGLKWATCNVGANSPEEYGDYFAWGETEPKENYDWSTYKWCNGSYYNLTKYNTSNINGTVDNKTVLDLEDDAARANWGENWRIPTDADWTELRTECTWTWTTQNGKYGSLVTGPNGKSIFLPATGGRGGTSLYDAGTYGDYRSSSLNTDMPKYSSDMGFGSGGAYRGNGFRCNGHAVRPVYEDPISVSGVSLDKTEITLAGYSIRLEATVLPVNASEKGVTWSSGNPSVVSVSTDGLVSANQVGYAVITVTTVDGGFQATCQVTVNAPSQYEAVDLGLPSSLKWASCNVGANSPEEYGDYFAWGETTPKENYDWPTYKWCNGSVGTLTKYNYDSSDYGTVDHKIQLELSDDVARANWGGNWRIPTDAEWTELRAECTWLWETKGGTNGYKVTGPNGKSIFIPAAGSRNVTNLNNAGSSGNYWSSSLNTDSPPFAYYVSFYLAGVSRSYYSRCFGSSVRPVTE